MSKFSPIFANSEHQHCWFNRAVQHICIIITSSSNNNNIHHTHTRKIYLVRVKRNENLWSEKETENGKSMATKIICKSEGERKERNSWRNFSRVEGKKRYSHSFFFDVFYSRSIFLHIFFSLDFGASVTCQNHFFTLESRAQCTPIRFSAIAALLCRAQTAVSVQFWHYLNVPCTTMDLHWKKFKLNVNWTMLTHGNAIYLIKCTIVLIRSIYRIFEFFQYKSVIVLGTFKWCQYCTETATSVLFYYFYWYWCCCRGHLFSMVFQCKI